MDPFISNVVPDTNLLLSSTYLQSLPGGMYRPMNNPACAAVEIVPKRNGLVEITAIPAISKQKHFTVRQGDWIKLRPVSGKMLLQYRAPELPIEFFNCIPGSDLDKNFMTFHDAPTIELKKNEVAFVFNEKGLADKSKEATKRFHGTSRNSINMDDLVLFINNTDNLVKPITRVAAGPSAGKNCADMLTSALARLGYNPWRSAEPFEPVQ